MNDARLVIMDEPTAALDAEAEAGLIDGLQGLTRGTTAVIVSHRLSLARRVDRITVRDRAHAREGELMQRLHHWQLVLSVGPGAPEQRRSYGV